MRVLLVGNHWTAGPGGAETVLVLTADLLPRRRPGRTRVARRHASEAHLAAVVGAYEDAVMGRSGRGSRAVR